MGIQPLGTLALLRPAPERMTDSGLHIPDSAGASADVKRGEVVALGPQAADPVVGLPTLQVGDLVYYLAGAERAAVGEEVLVPAEAIVGRSPASEDAEVAGECGFFTVDRWEEFKGSDYQRWEEYTRVRLFTVVLSFLQPFQRLEAVAKMLHEQVATAAREHPSLERQLIHFSRLPSPKGTHTDYRIDINDDRLGGTFHISEENNTIAFIRTDTDIEALVRILPIWIGTLGKMARSSTLRPLFGQDFERISFFTFKWSQTIRLLGRGVDLEQVRNPDLLKQFLLLEGRGDKPATLSALGFDEDAVGRIDMKVGFDKEIIGRTFRIFLDIGAPANDDQRKVLLNWEVQDLNPGDLSQVDYGPAFSSFVRDTVCRSFYRTWFRKNDSVKVATVWES